MPGQSVSNFRGFCIYVGRRCRENAKGGLYEFSTLCRRADKQGRAFL